MAMIDRRLFVVSAAVHNIVWMGESFGHVAPSVRLWSQSHMSSNINRNKSLGEACSFSFSEANSVYVGQYTISTEGIFSMNKSPVGLDSVTQLNHDIARRQQENRLLDVAAHRCVAMTSQYLVRADVLSKSRVSTEAVITQDLFEGALVSIHPIMKTSDDKKEPGDYLTVMLPHVGQVSQIFFLEQEQYAVLVVCSSDFLDPYRFGAHIYEVVLIHLETATLIGRLTLPVVPTMAKNNAPQFDAAFGTLSSCLERIERHFFEGGTGCVNTGGIVMAGPSVRNAPLDASMRTMKKRPKGKRRQNGKQKDGFQRGKCLFG